MQQIPLTQGKQAFIDDEDFEDVSRHRWCYRGERDGRQGYAVRHHKVDGKDRLQYLHRTILAAPEGFEVIFLNYDRLDCRRANLRVVTKEEARQHHRVRSDSRTGVKGVKYNLDTDTWSAYTYRHGHCYHIGRYSTKEQAIAAYEQEMKAENPSLHAAPEPVQLPIPDATSSPAPRGVSPPKRSKRRQFPSGLELLRHPLPRTSSRGEREGCFFSPED